MFKSVRQPLFNAEGDIGGGQADGNESVSSNADSFTPGWGLPNDGNQAAGANPLFSPEPAAAPAEQPVQPVQTGQVFDFAGRKIEVADPAIAAALKDVHKDYTALTGTFTQTSQRMKELEQANQTYLNLLNQAQQQPQAQSMYEQQAEPEQDLELMKADFLEKFYENPMTALEGMLDQMFQQKVQPIIEPISKERAWNEQVQGLQTKYPDFQEMIGPMQQLVEEMPELAQHGLESVYHFAKRSQPAQAPTPEQLLTDPNFLQQMMQNQDVQNQFLSKYLQEKQGQPTPTLMGGQPGGQMPTATDPSPKDLKTGSKAFKRFLGLS